MAFARHPSIARDVCLPVSQSLHKCLPVCLSALQYAAQYADDPMRVQTFNDWLYSRTLIEAGRVASFVQGESEGYIGTIAVQRFIKERVSRPAMPTQRHVRLTMSRLAVAGWRWCAGG